MSRAITRTSTGATLNMPASPVFNACGLWVEACSTSRPSVTSATQPRGSIDWASTRVTWLSSRTRRGAAATAARAAAQSPRSQTKPTLFSTSSQTADAPGARASRVSVTISMSSKSTSTSSAASRATARVSETIKATPSPVNRALPSASIGRKAGRPVRCSASAA